MVMIMAMAVEVAVVALMMMMMMMMHNYLLVKTLVFVESSTLVLVAQSLLALVFDTPFVALHFALKYGVGTDLPPNSYSTIYYPCYCIHVDLSYY